MTERLSFMIFALLFLYLFIFLKDISCKDDISEVETPVVLLEERKIGILS